jgi:hypothetical protein
VYPPPYAVNRSIDLPRAWAERVHIKQILPLSADLTKKVQIIHRIAFYRENILDLMKETYFEHILVLVPPPLFRHKPSAARTSSTSSSRNRSLNNSSTCRPSPLPLPPSPGPRKQWRRRQIHLKQTW